MFSGHRLFRSPQGFVLSIVTPGGDFLCLSRGGVSYVNNFVTGFQRLHFGIPLSYTYLLYSLTIFGLRTIGSIVVMVWLVLRRMVLVAAFKSTRGAVD